MQYREWSVTDIIRKSLPVSITLGLFALLIALLLGVGVGTLAAVQRGGALDWLSLSISLVGISVPRATPRSPSVRMRTIDSARFATAARVDISTIGR